MIRTALILTLSSMASTAAAQDGGSLAQLLQRGKDPLVRESAAQIMGLRGGREAIPLLLRRMKDDDNRWVRARCAEALGRLGAVNAIKALRSALGREKDQRVRRAVGECSL